MTRVGWVLSVGCSTSVQLHFGNRVGDDKTGWAASLPHEMGEPVSCVRRRIARWMLCEGSAGRVVHELHAAATGQLPWVTLHIDLMLMLEFDAHLVGTAEPKGDLVLMASGIAGTSIVGEISGAS